MVLGKDFKKPRLEQIAQISVGYETMFIRFHLWLSGARNLNIYTRTLNSYCIYYLSEASF